MLGGHHNPLGHKISGVEPHSELADHTDIGASRKRLHKLLGPGASDGAKVVDEIGFGHADTAVDDGQGVGGLVRNDVDEKLRLGVELAFVRETLEPDFVQRLLRAPDQ